MIQRKSLPVALSAVALVATIATPATVSGDAIARTAAQKFSIVSVSPHCLDENDEEFTVYVNEGDKPCKIAVRVTGRGKTKSKISLNRYDDDAEKWGKSDTRTQTTNTAGRATITVNVKFPSAPGDQCYSLDNFTHRFTVAKSGKYRAFNSSSFEIVFTSAEDNPACIDSGDEPSEDDDNFDIDDEE